MFGSTILDLAIGLIFTFLIISLVTSTATEALASVLGWRANTLLQGIKDLLNDQNFKGLALSIYNHGLTNPQANGTATEEKDLTAKPSYINEKQFASALTELAGISSSVTGSPSEIVKAMEANIDTNIKDPQLNTTLKGIVDRAGGDINKINTDISQWFNQGMERVAGVYKRWTQYWTLGIALGLAIALNLDTVRIAQALWDQPMLLKSLSPLASGVSAADALQKFQDLGLPFGWDTEAIKYFTHCHWYFALAGWIITALATLFGAPFWFDTLQKFVQLRGAGDK